MVARSTLALAFGSLLGALLTSHCAALIIDPLPLSNFTNGSALFWGGPQDGQDDPFNMRLPPGACGYGEMDSKMWPNYLIAGISPHSTLVRDRPQASCGTCLEVKCTSPEPKVCRSNASITVVITDECPSCAANQLNLHAFAFEQIARLEYGSAAIQYRQVECSPVENITVRVDGFRVAQGGWLRLSLKSVASDAGIVRVELARSQNGAVGSKSAETAHAATPPAARATAPASNRTAPAAPKEPELLEDAEPAPTGAWPNATAPDGTDGNRVWKAMDNTYGAEWEVSALPAPPYDLRLTDAYGRQVVLVGVITRAGALGEFPGHGQFGGLDKETIAAKPPTVIPLEIPASANATSPKPTATVKKAVATAKPATPVASAKPAAVPSVTALSAKPAVAAAATKPTIAGTRRRLQQLQRAAHGQLRRLRQGTRGEEDGPMP